MKKVISFMLCLIMLFTVAIPAFSAAAADEVTPIIYIRGNGQEIYNADGEKVICDIGDLKLDAEGEESRNKIIEAATNISLSFLMGMSDDNWDDYGEAIYKEISPLFEQAMLDGNGNPQFGTGIHPDLLKKTFDNSKKNLTNNGKCGYYTYGYHFDWRLDPYDLVDDLHTYITNVMTATDKRQVSLTSRCLGGSLLNAYLEKYGHLGHIKNVMYCDTLSNGCTLISKGFSGQVEFDAKSIQIYESQLGYLDEIGYSTGLNITDFAGEITEKALDLFTQLGFVDTVADNVEKLYNRLYKALIPALFKSIGYASQPAYWTFVKEEDFDLALEIMFGEEGSEERVKNEGLITKILNYREKVTSVHDELLKKFSEDYGIHIGVIAKYGLIAAPLTSGYGNLSDTLASLEDSSFGATCAKIGKTLPSSYIEERTQKGFGEYISADKQVDTSTCLFPETTWIVKNVHHDDFDRCCKALAEEFLSGTDVTVENSGYARFRVNDYEKNEVYDMSEDNCGDLDFLTIPEDNPSIITRVMSLLRLVFVIFSRLFENLPEFKAFLS